MAGLEIEPPSDPKTQAFSIPLGLEGGSCVWILKGHRIIPCSPPSPSFEWQPVVATTWGPGAVEAPLSVSSEGRGWSWTVCMDVSLWDIGAAAIAGGAPSSPHCPPYFVTDSPAPFAYLQPVGLPPNLGVVPGKQVHTGAHSSHLQIRLWVSRGSGESQSPTPPSMPPSSAQSLLTHSQ